MQNSPWSTTFLANIKLAFFLLFFLLFVLTEPFNLWTFVWLQILWKYIVVNSFGLILVFIWYLGLFFQWSFLFLYYGGICVWLSLSWVSRKPRCDKQFVNVTLVSEDVRWMIYNNSVISALHHENEDKLQSSHDLTVINLVSDDNKWFYAHKFIHARAWQMSKMPTNWNLDEAVSSFWQIARDWNQGNKAKLELSCEDGSLHLQLSDVVGHPDQPTFLSLLLLVLLLQI